MHQLDLLTAFLYWIPTIVIVITMIAILSTSFWRYRKKHEKRRQIQREYNERAFSGKRPRIGALRCYTHAVKVTDMMQSFSGSEINRILKSYNGSGVPRVDSVPEEDESKDMDDSSLHKSWNESFNATPRGLPRDLSIHDDLFYENSATLATKRTKHSLDFDDCDNTDIILGRPGRKRKRKKKKNRFLISKSKQEDDITKNKDIDFIPTNDTPPVRLLQRSKTLPEWTNEAVPREMSQEHTNNVRLVDAWIENDSINGLNPAVYTSTDQTGYSSNDIAVISGDTSIGCYEGIKYTRGNRKHKEAAMPTMKPEISSIYRNNENTNNEKVFWIDTSDIQQSSV